MSSEAFPEAPQDEHGTLLETPDMRAFGLAALRRMMAAAADGEAAAGAGAGAGAAPAGPRGSSPWPREDDAFLLAFLRARKYKVDKAFAVLRKFSRFWAAPETRAMLHGASAEGLRRFYVGGPTRLLQGRDAQGAAVTTLNAGKMDAALVDYTAQVHLSMLSLAWMLEPENEEVQLRGITIVETFEHFSLAAAMGLRGALSSKQQKALTDFFTDAMPVRIRHIYVIKQPWYFSMVWAVARLFFKKKITDRVQLFGSDVAKLHALVPASILPPEFGGTLDEPVDAAITRFVDIEKRGGTCGGFAMPFNFDAVGGERKGDKVAI
jgi:CRAL/TRIO domain/CRAL/TRIO, N-terminal domain